MRTSVVIGIAAVGLVGGVAAAMLLAWTTGPSTGEPAPVEVSAMDATEPTSSRTFERDPAPDAALPVGQPRLQRPVRRDPALDPADVPEGEHTRPDLGPAFDGPVGSLADLGPRYEVAMSATLNLSDLPPGASGGDVEKALQERLLHTTATVETAAQDHLDFARTAPRDQAEQARGRAAELYDHLAGTLSEAPVPGHLPEHEVQLQRQMMERMADQQRRKAQALRASR